MKKVFVVEVDFDEVEGREGVLYGYSMENMLGQWMDGFVETNSITEQYALNVREITKQDGERNLQTKYIEQSSFALQEAIDGTWEFVKNRFGNNNGVIEDGEVFYKNNSNVALFYADGSIKVNFKTYS